MKDGSSFSLLVRAARPPDHEGIHPGPAVKDGSSLHLSFEQHVLLIMRVSIHPGPAVKDGSSLHLSFEQHVLLIMRVHPGRAVKDGSSLSPLVRAARHPDHEGTHPGPAVKDDSSLHLSFEQHVLLRVAIGEAGTFVLNVSTADTRVLTVVGNTGDFMCICLL